MYIISTSEATRKKIEGFFYFYLTIEFPLDRIIIGVPQPKFIKYKGLSIHLPLQDFYSFILNNWG